MKKATEESQPRQSPLITLVTATWNFVESGRLESFHQMMYSIANSNIPNGLIEHIVIDGGSSEKNISVLDEYKRLGQIDHYVSQPDNGIYNAMNKGIRLATGKYIMFMNDDDFFLVGGLKEIISNLQKHDPEITYSNAVVRSDEKSAVYQWYSDISLIFFRMPMNHQTVAIRREILEKVGGFDESYTISADYDLIVRLYLGRYRFHKIESYVASYSLDGFSNDLEARLTERYQVQQKYFYPFANLDILMLFENAPYDIIDKGEKYLWALRILRERMDTELFCELEKSLKKHLLRTVKIELRNISVFEKRIEDVICIVVEERMKRTTKKRRRLDSAKNFIKKNRAFRYPLELYRNLQAKQIEKRLYRNRR